MIALYLIAAHMIGDYVLQTRWQARWKATDYRYRFRHVVAYCLPFFPIAFVFGRNSFDTWLFMTLLALLHNLTDSRRFHSTLGDVVGWARLGQEQRLLEWQDAPAYESLGRTSDSLPPNPWTPISLLIDQTLHLCQLALLGGLLLR